MYVQAGAAPQIPQQEHEQAERKSIATEFNPL